VLDETPPELISDLMEHGIVLSGGSSQLRNLDQRLSEDSRMRVRGAEEPMTCVAKGAGRILEELDTLHKVLTDMQRRGVMR
jgi:rod shape-determining protein MreB